MINILYNLSKNRQRNLHNLILYIKSIFERRCKRLKLKGKKVGFVLTGSFCTFRTTIQEMQNLVKLGANVFPIMSFNSYNLDTKFGKAKDFIAEIENSGYFVTNQSGKVLSDQTVRRMINKYSSLASIKLHITPHMFRHTFATSLLEADVDIRFIQYQQWIERSSREYRAIAKSKKLLFCSI